MGANGGAIDAVMAAVSHDLGERYGDGLPDPRFAPPAEPSIDGVPAPIFGRNVAPRRSAPEPPKDSVDDSAVPLWPPASATVLRLDGQQAFQNAPFRFSKIAPAQTCLQKEALNQSLSMASITIVTFGIRTMTMDASPYPWNEPATLVWLFPGDNLDEDDFDWAWVNEPPDENPQSWATFREAVEFASTADCSHAKGAWITIGEQIFNPVDVFEAYQTLNR